jgi:hypothetical protein
VSQTGGKIKNEGVGALWWHSPVGLSVARRRKVISAKTNEVFVSDGYINRRVAVFDADSGKYKRHWGAYGKRPDDAVKLTRSGDGPPP